MSTPESTAEPGAQTKEPGAEAAEPSTAAMPEPAPEATPEPATEARPDALAEPMPTAWPGTMPEPLAEVLPEALADPLPAARTEPDPAAAGDDLRAAVGLPGQPARRDAQPRGPGRRRALLIAAIALLGAGVAGLVFLGQQNQQRYYLVCGEDDITAAQGRSFPPWGWSALEGKAWQAIPRPLDAACEDRVFDSREALARRFGETLVAQAEAWVTAREDGAGRERLAEVQAQLDQAQRVLRDLGDPKAALGELSGKLQRLRGDLDYWHARDRIDTALAELARAAQHLDRAVAQDPHHNREDARMWQRVITRLQAELGQGTPGATPAPAPTTATPGATPGAALPAAPEAPARPGTDSPSDPSADSPDPAAGSTSDAGPVSPPVPGATAPATPPPDAGVRRGGLLI